MDIKIGDGVFLKTSKLQYVGTVAEVLDEPDTVSYKIYWNDNTETWEGGGDVEIYRQKYLDLLAK